jgi:hypothetical protein
MRTQQFKNATDKSWNAVAPNQNLHQQSKSLINFIIEDTYAADKSDEVMSVFVKKRCIGLQNRMKNL